jgi:hypothetical protein
VHRRVLPLIAAAALGGCSSSPPSSTSPDDGGGDASVPCFGFACGGSITPEELDASLAVRVRTRFDLCNAQEGCHVSGAGQLDFPPGNELANLIDAASSERPDLVRVHPGDPLGSYLYLKVRGDGGIEGGRMPLNATYDPRIPATILAWIEAGAPAQ